MDKICIRNLKLSCTIGMEKEERAYKQDIFVDIKLHTHTPRTDSIEDTINYSEVVGKIKDTLEPQEYCLIETLAEKIAELLLAGFPTRKVEITVKKPSALKGKADYAAVEIVRKKNI